MPALNGQIITTVTDATGSPAVAVTWFYNPSSPTRALRNNPAPWLSPDGTNWPTGSGALIAANLTGRQVRVTVNDSNGATVRQVKIPAGGGALTAAQLANAPAPDGPYTSADDFNGLTLDVS
jgi:hypothetical protein